MALPITFNYDNTLERAVGDEGLRVQDLKSAQASASAAVEAVRGRVDAGEIGFPLLADDNDTLKAVQQFANSMRSKIDDVLLVGIGGSALGPYALDVAIRGPHPVQLGVDGKVSKKAHSATPRLVVLDNVDPGFIASALAQLNPKRTAVCVIAKSGSTAETLATFLVVREWMYKALGKKARGQIIAITDAHKGDLLAVAKEEKYPLFFIPANVGGRFSAFTPVGLVPAALIGLDVKKLLKGARDANAVCWSKDMKKNPALASALVHYGLERWQQKQIEVVFAYSQYLWGSAFWYRQLWAESIGKEKNRNGKTVEVGQTPVAALGVTDQHSQVQLYVEGPRDKMITFWEVLKPRVDVKIPKDLVKYDSAKYLGGKTLGQLFRAERLATEAALTKARRPNCRWTLARVDEYTVGMFFEMLEFQTAFAGELYGINAFDQPGVELAKKMTYGLMGRKEYAEFAKGLK
jgi:glucose-6-phosphate isomerase